MYPAPFVALAMAVAGPVPAPGQPSSAPSALPAQEPIPGWEVSPETDAARRDCDRPREVMARALNPPQRQEAVRLLEKDIALPLSDAEAARWLGRRLDHAKRLATALLEERLDQLRSVRDCIKLRKLDRCKRENDHLGWGPSDEEELGRLAAAYERGDHRHVRPYLVRGVAKFGDGHGGGPPVMLGGLCGDDLTLVTFVFSNETPPSERVPAVVFLPRRPARIWAWVYLAM